MNRFDNESRRTAEARNGNGGELGAAARELSKIAVEETKNEQQAYRSGPHTESVCLKCGAG